MATSPEVKRELELIENAEWRILSASSDEEKLQRLLKVYLAPLLVKAGSEHVSVRNKVGANNRCWSRLHPPADTLDRSYRHARRSTS